MKVPISSFIYTEGDIEGVRSAMLNGQASGISEVVGNFGKNLSAFTKIEHMSPCTNGTVALMVALLALELPKKATIAIPGLCFGGVANAILTLGFRIQTFDISEEDFFYSDDTLKDFIERGAIDALFIIPQFGVSPDSLPAIRHFALKHNVAVIEDRAELFQPLNLPETDIQFFSQTRWICTYSFFANKPLALGEGGSVGTFNNDLLGKIQSIINHGMNPFIKYDHCNLGLNARMPALVAAVGLSKLNAYPRNLERRWIIYDRFLQWFSKNSERLNGIHFRYLSKDKDVPWFNNLWIDDSGRRSDFIAEMQNMGCDVRPVVKSISASSAFTSDQDLPTHRRCKMIEESLCHLPCDPDITDAQYEYYLKSLGKVLSWG